MSLTYRLLPGSQVQAQLSADGHWIAYTSDETGQPEVFVQSFPTPGSIQKISTSGGAQPQWRRDGKELFYLSKENNLMAVPVRTGALPRFDPPQKLFHIALSVNPLAHRNDYAVNHDGSRFLVSAPLSNPPPIIVRFNWDTALSK